MTNLELITLLTKSSGGKNIPIPFPQFNHVAKRYNASDWKYRYQDILELNEENPDLDTEGYVSIKKVLLLYDWIGNKEIKEIEEVYKIYGGAIRKLGEGFSWLADSLAAVAESLGWSKKKNKKEELAGRIKKRFPAVLSLPPSKNYKPKTRNPELETCNFSPVSASSLSKTETRNPKPVTVLEIDTHRPDRVIFKGEKIEVTATEFSLIHLLALHNGQVMSYDELSEELWENEEDAIYNRVSFHISKIRRTILKTIGKRKMNEEKVKDIFVVVPKRGVMIKLKAEEIKIK